MPQTQHTKTQVTCTKRKALPISYPVFSDKIANSTYNHKEEIQSEKLYEPSVSSQIAFGEENTRLLLDEMLTFEQIT